MLLSLNQQNVVECQSHALVLACPGSGKTLTLAKKAEYQLKIDLKAKITIATFTRDSAVDIRKRIISVVGKHTAQRVDSGTFHALALEQLKQGGYRFTIINEAHAKQYIKRAMEACGFKDMELKTATGFIEQCRSNPDFEPANDDLGKLFSSYENLLERDNAIDFQGIIFKAVQLMRCGKLKAINSKCLFVDESQDMDQMQLAWCIEHIKAGVICTLVGDDDQSIYKFRGAEGYEGMMRFRNEFVAKQFLLNTNYRSKKEILDAANRVIAINSNRIKKNIVAERGNGGSVEAWQCADGIAEAKLAVSKIISACSNNENFCPEKYSIGVKDREWAVLARNKYNLNLLAIALAKNKIPYSFKEKDEWSEEPVCFALRLLYSVVIGDMAGLNSALHFSGIDQGVLAKCSKFYNNDFELFVHCSREVHLVEFGNEVSSKILVFSGLVQIWESDLNNERTSHVIQGVFNWFVGQLNERYIRGEKSLQKEINQLNIASKKLSGMSGTLKRRLQNIMIGVNSEHKNGNQVPGVCIGTLHSAKGLEFKNVWILQVEEGIIPDVKLITQAAFEEERRLFYVGITRAKDSLFLSSTKSPSKFLLETGIEIKKEN